MKIGGTTSIKANGYVLSGYYAWNITGNSKAKLFEFSSSSFGIENFTAPYDAILPYWDPISGYTYK